MNQLKAGALLSYAVLFLNNIVGLLYMPFMIHMLGKSEYGLYSLAASVISYLTILDLGFGNAIVRYTAKLRAEGKTTEQYEMFGMFIVVYSLIGITAFCLGLLFYFNVDMFFASAMDAHELERVRIMLLLMIFNVAFTFPFSLFGSIIIAYERFVFQKVIQLIRIFLNTAVMVHFLFLGYRAVALIVITTIFNLFSLLINYFYCRHKIRIKIYFRRFRWELLKEIISYSFYIFLNAIMDRIYWSTGQFVLGAVSGTAAVAVYAVAIQLQHMYMSFSTAISGVFLPKVTRMVVSEQSDQAVSDLFTKTGRVQFIILSFILSGFVVFGRQFITLWAGPGYENAYFIALLFFIPLTIPLIQNLGITILQARNRLKFRSLLYLVISLVSLALQIPLAKKYGGIGCAVAIAGALILGQIIVMNIYYSISQKINILAFWRNILGMSLVPALLMPLFTFISHFFVINSILKLFVGIAVFSCIYIPLFWFWGMNNFERKLVIRPFLRFTRNQGITV